MRYPTPIFRNIEIFDMISNTKLAHLPALSHSPTIPYTFPEYGMAERVRLLVHLRVYLASLINIPSFCVKTPKSRFVAASRRRDEKLKGVDKPEVRRAQNKEMSKEDAAEPQRSTQGDEKAGNGFDIGSERTVATGREHVRKTASQKNRAISSGRTRRKTKGGGGSSGGKDKRGAGKEGGEQQLKPEAIYQELRECAIFHDV